MEKLNKRDINMKQKVIVRDVLKYTDNFSDEVILEIIQQLSQKIKDRIKKRRERK